MSKINRHNIKVYFWTLNSFPLISMSFDLSIDLYLYASNTLFWLLQIFSNFLEKAMATHSITLAWKTPWMEEPCRLQSMGSLRVGYDWETSLSFFTFVHWRRQWQPTPVFLTGESQGRGSLVGCCLWGPTESDTTERDLAAAASFQIRSCKSYNFALLFQDCLFTTLGFLHLYMNFRITLSISRTSLVAQTVKCLPTIRESQVQSLGREDPLKKEMATHSSTLAWKIPWTDKPGKLQSMVSQESDTAEMTQDGYVPHLYLFICIIY